MLFSFLFHIVFTLGDYDIDNIKKETSQGDDLGGFDMSDHYFDDFSKEPTRDLDTTPEESSVRSETAAQESSYEWNSSSSHSDGEYHYSFINGNNSDSAHNPNNYEDAVSRQSVQDYSAPQGSAYDSAYASPQSSNPYSSDYTAPQSTNPYSSSYTAHEQATASHRGKPKKEKKAPKSASRGFVAAALAVAILASGAIGFGGGMLAGNKNNSSSGKDGALNITQVASSGKTTDGKTVSTGTSAGGTSEIVKKTADSVVEIATEGVATGSFARQYVTKGAGSGVIISEDGYIVTNHHVIDGAEKITVTLRDGETTYDATLIGSDADNDVALIKIDAKDLTPAVFGNSSDLVVGDYVVAIGNPLGTLGGTVTDGIISALAREVTIEDKNLTLLQTNAQISPGNSGGGLFNANGELVGIVNAKDSATEVEGIAFAIPINNVINVIKDLKEYGYVTGKISTGMQFVDINSDYSAFYYGVQKQGVYVLSVDSGSNAEKAGFERGDLITAVEGTEVLTEAEITKELEKHKVGDTVTFTVTRNRQSKDITMELAEYVPSAQPKDNNSQSFRDYQSDDEFWNDLIGW